MLIYQKGGTGFIAESELIKNQSWLPLWKVLTPKAADGSGRSPLKVLGNPIVARPGEACTETYLVAGVYDTEREARNLAAYLESKFFRLLVSLRKPTQDCTAAVFSFVPKLNMKVRWSDKELYKRYELTQYEIDFVESQIKEMST